LAQNLFNLFYDGFGFLKTSGFCSHNDLPNDPPEALREVPDFFVCFIWFMIKNQILLSQKWCRDRYFATRCRLPENSEIDDANHCALTA
jgi:hypothetical protein